MVAPMVVVIVGLVGVGAVVSPPTLKEDRVRVTSVPKIGQHASLNRIVCSAFPSRFFWLSNTAFLLAALVQTQDLFYMRTAHIHNTNTGNGAFLTQRLLAVSVGIDEGLC